MDGKRAQNDENLFYFKSNKGYNKLMNCGFVIGFRIDLVIKLFTVFINIMNVMAA